MNWTTLNWRNVTILVTGATIIGALGERFNVPKFFVVSHTLAWIAIAPSIFNKERQSQGRREDDYKHR